MVNKLEYRVIGMSRSGNHAVINWILRQSEGRTCFLNCAEPRTNPFLSARPMDHGQPYEVNYASFNWSRERRGDFSTKDLLVFSHEDVFLGPVSSHAFEKERDKMVGPSQHRQDVLILRDPFNLFASRLKSPYEFLTSRNMTRIWKQHAREFLRSRYLSPSSVCISYNRWASSRAYRRELANRLRLRFNDSAIHDVPPCGGGSSFDHRRLHGKANAMRVFSRWRAFVNDVDYWELFDEEIFRLALTIFGSSPARAAESARRRVLSRYRKAAPDRAPVDSTIVACQRSLVTRSAEQLATVEATNNEAEPRERQKMNALSEY